MYYEDYEDVRNAIAREKQLKKWLREWKIDIIKKDNPEMKDLAADTQNSLRIRSSRIKPGMTATVFIESETPC
jgi:hypothetical protein